MFAILKRDTVSILLENIRYLAWQLFGRFHKGFMGSNPIFEKHMYVFSYLKYNDFIMSQV